MSRSRIPPSLKRRSANRSITAAVMASSISREASPRRSLRAALILMSASARASSSSHRAARRSSFSSSLSRPSTSGARAVSRAPCASWRAKGAKLDPASGSFRTCLSSARMRATAASRTASIFGSPSSTVSPCTAPWAASSATTRPAFPSCEAQAIKLSASTRTTALTRAGVLTEPHCGG